MPFAVQKSEAEWRAASISWLTTDARDGRALGRREICDASCVPGSSPPWSEPRRQRSGLHARHPLGTHAMTTPTPTGTHLDHFFSASAARLDRWRELNAKAQAWAADAQ